MVGYSLGMAAALGGGLFLGYCIYFDHKRRSHPDFKKNLIAKRKRQREEAAKKKNPGIPDLSDPEAMQKFFLQELELGEELLQTGDLEQGLYHLSNAVVICPSPQQLLGVMQQSLPAPVFQLLLSQLPAANERVSVSEASRAGAGRGPGVSVQELMDDELE